MLHEQPEAPWLAASEAVLSRCGLRPGDVVAVLSESQSQWRPVLPQLARYTPGHFELPLRNCTITLDDVVVVDAGRLPGLSA